MSEKVKRSHVSVIFDCSFLSCVVKYLMRLFKKWSSQTIVFPSSIEIRCQKTLKVFLFTFFLNVCFEVALSNILVDCSNVRLHWPVSNRFLQSFFLSSVLMWTNPRSMLFPQDFSLFSGWLWSSSDSKPNKSEKKTSTTFHFCSNSWNVCHASLSKNKQQYVLITFTCFDFRKYFQKQNSNPCQKTTTRCQQKTNVFTSNCKSRNEKERLWQVDNRV